MAHQRPSLVPNDLAAHHVDLPPRRSSEELPGPSGEPREFYAIPLTGKLADAPPPPAGYLDLLPGPKEDLISISVRLPASQVRYLRELKEKHGVESSKAIRAAIDHFMRLRETKPAS